MGDREEDMQQGWTQIRKDPGRIRTRVAAVRTEPIWYALYPMS